MFSSSQHKSHPSLDNTRPQLPNSIVAPALHPKTHLALHHSRTRNLQTLFFCERYRTDYETDRLKGFHTPHLSRASVVLPWLDLQSIYRDDTSWQAPDTPPVSLRTLPLGERQE